MDKIKEKRIKEGLTEKLSIYIPAIVKMFGRYMNNNTKERLKSIGDYSSLVMFDYSGKVTAFAGGKGIIMPIGAEIAFEKLKSFNNFKSNPNHKSYTKETLIENENTYEDYIKHLICVGADVEIFLNDTLLHETLHFCGSGGGGISGAGAFKEGLNEYLTRIVAKENNFKTSGCGYPKEIKIVIELEKILGTEQLFKIAFLNDLKSINEFLVKEVGEEKTYLFNNVVTEMEKEFYLAYYSKIKNYVGFEGAMQKAKNYKNIDYSKVYDIINEYKDTVQINITKSI